MPSTRELFVYFLLFTFSGCFSFGENFASGFLSDPNQPNWLSAKFRALIGATRWFPGVKPLFIFTALDETCLVNQTTTLLDVKIVTPNTVGSITGGVLGDDIYRVDHFDLYWQNGLCNVTHNLKAYVYSVNWKYESFEKAQDYPDGIVVHSYPISTNGDIPNGKFDAFSKILGYKIKEPGDFLNVHSAFTYTWFVSFPYDSIYHSCTQQFADPSSGKKYTATVLELPLDPRTNFISNEQFLKTFGKIKRDSEDGSANTLGQSCLNKSSKRHKGICVVNLPA